MLRGLWRVWLIVLLCAGSALSVSAVAYGAEKTTGQAVRQGFEVIQITIALAACMGVGLCLLLIVQLVFPGLIATAVEGLERSLLRSLLLGLVVFVAGFVFVFVASRVAQPLAALLLVFLASFFGLLGAATASEYLGRRILSTSEASWSRSGTLGIGWLVWTGASITPILGWFVILPVLAFCGIGAVARPLWRRKTQGETACATDTALPAEAPAGPENEPPA